ncbi:hypothetical protein [Draconibacterium halophilum]|uniref:hypothetical protein n=1 Tax=Draconibacterium halophilum TaxID=2706887 RepID=UPI00193EC4D3|nr:hypothetical protein [Draconibacterium halophilum]
MSKPTKITPNPYKEIAGFENGKHQFGFNACLKWLEDLGKKTYGQQFQLYPEDSELLYRLIVYAIEDKEVAEKRNLDLKKVFCYPGRLVAGKPH